jgi:hypothetical protein
MERFERMFYQLSTYLLMVFAVWTSHCIGDLDGSLDDSPGTGSESSNSHSKFDEMFSIDHKDPSQHLSAISSYGDPEAIQKLSNQLRKRTERETIASVVEWADKNLVFDPSKAYRWRDFDIAVKDKCYGGCADYSIVCGALLRSAGIPTIWVKTMDVDWIWALKKKKNWDAWKGHVFLEIYVEGRWVLFDPGAKTIYSDYSTSSRILPGNRFAYHKGDDPKQMVMSLDWEEWNRQTSDYFSQLDASLLPVDTSSSIYVSNQGYIAANDPYYKLLTRLANQLGLSSSVSFNSDYETFLPQARGKLLLIETHGSEPIVPPAMLEKHYPGAMRGIESGGIEIDGTDIRFVDVDAILLKAFVPTSTSR